MLQFIKITSVMIITNIMQVLNALKSRMIIYIRYNLKYDISNIN